MLGATGKCVKDPLPCLRVLLAHPHINLSSGAGASDCARLMAVAKQHGLTEVQALLEHAVRVWLRGRVGGLCALCVCVRVCALGVGVCACGRVGVWACGRVGVWACGRVGVWACGRVGVWACGRVGVWAPCLPFPQLAVNGAGAPLCSRIYVLVPADLCTDVL